MAKPCVWIVGDWRPAIFSDALKWLALHSNVVCVDDVAATAKLLVPAAILLVQSRPGQISQREVEQLHAAAPLSRLIALVGPWCEGEMRSGRPWPGVVRVPWRNWRERLPKELGWSDGPGDHQSRLPRTTTENEHIERDSRGIVQHAKTQQFARIHTDSRINYESIAAALGTAGITAAWALDDHSTPDQQIDLLIYDGWEHVPGGAGIALAPRLTIPAVLLLHFPRPEDFERAETVGISRIVAQPLLLHDLAATLKHDVACA